MPQPVKIVAGSAELGVGKQVKVHLKTTPANVSNQQGQQIFQQVNQNLGKKPKHPHQNQNGNNPPKPQNQNAGDQPKTQKPAEHQIETKGDQFPFDTETNLKKGNQESSKGQPPPKVDLTINNNNQPTNITTQNQTQPVENNPVQPQVVNTNQTQPPTNLEIQNNGQNNPALITQNTELFPNLKQHPNNQHHQDNLINVVVKQVFQKNDIHLSNNDVNKLVDRPNFQTQRPLPPEIKDLVQNIKNQATTILDNSPKLNGKTAHQVANEISRQFHEQIQTTKNTLLQNADLNAKPFSRTNIEERMKTAIELIPPHLSAKEAENLQKNTTQEVLNAFLLTRGLIIGDEKSSDVRNLIAFKPSVLPNDMSLMAFRDVGQLVKILISNGAIAKNTAELDLSVQRFVRILIANNELGVLLAAVNLTRQANSPGTLVSRTMALVQIYELINRLVLAGEKAMKEASVQIANKNIWLNTEQKNVVANQKITLTDADEKNIQGSKLFGTGAESSLRQFLEFNPNSVFDNSASTFFNPDDSRQAAKDFSTLHQRDIEQWLNSGNHRFVKDYDFDKPIGIVVERNNDGYFTASKMRIILIRDGSVQGWHVLKSILVK